MYRCLTPDEARAALNRGTTTGNEPLDVRYLMSFGEMLKRMAASRYSIPDEDSERALERIRV